MASTYLTRTQTAGNRRKGTFSAWFKKVNLSYQYLMSWNSTTSGTSYGDWIRFNGEQLDILKYTGSVVYRVQTNRLFRDTSAWYHLVVAYDSEQATASNRIKIYVNGVQETSFNESTYPSQNFDFQFNNNNIVACVGKNYNTEANFDGSMSHVHFIDGTAYDASAFGETDATTGEWKGKTSPSVTYGTNGFLILKDGNTITDQSSNSNDFTLGGGTLTDLKDNPDNVFATFNSLHNYYEGGTYAYGNNQITTGGSSKYTWNNSTLGMEAGKYYAEFKWVSGGSDILFGLTDRFTKSSTEELGHYATQYGYRTSGNVRNNDETLSGVTVATWTTGDIIGVAYDATNKKLYFAKNGTWQNSGDPTSGSTGTGAISVSASPQDGLYYFSSCGYDNSSTVLQANFGNGFFGTTAITTNSGNGYSGAEGSSKFNYTVPTGYSALSTKGLNE